MSTDPEFTHSAAPATFERTELLAADPEKTLFRGASEAFAPEALEEYVRCLRDPQTIHATCEDYRAATTTLDFAHDAEEREAGRRMIAAARCSRCGAARDSLRSTTTSWRCGADGPRK